MQDRTNQRVEQLHKLFLSEVNEKGVPDISLELFRYVLENNDRELFMYIKLAPDFIWNSFLEERERKKKQEKQAPETDSKSMFSRASGKFFESTGAYGIEICEEAIDFADWIINQRIIPSETKQCWYTLSVRYTSKELYIKFKNEQNEKNNKAKSNPTS